MSVVGISPMSWFCWKDIETDVSKDQGTCKKKSPGMEPVMELRPTLRMNFVMGAVVANKGLGRVPSKPLLSSCRVPMTFGKVGMVAPIPIPGPSNVSEVTDEVMLVMAFQSMMALVSVAVRR